jgi:AraC-like DNA-binding protein
VRTLIDLRRPAGWTELRSVIMNTRSQDIQRAALAQLASDLRGVPEDCWRFFEALFIIGPGVNSVRGLARFLGVLPSTLMSRFYRANLASPKKHLAMARLVRAAELFENPGLSIANVADHLEFSSSQSFGRHVRSTVQLSAADFRARYDGEGMLQRFREEMVLGPLPVLKEFQPLASPVGWYPMPPGKPQKKRRKRRGRGRPPRRRRGVRHRSAS